METVCRAFWVVGTTYTRIANADYDELSSSWSVERGARSKRLCCSALAKFGGTRKETARPVCARAVRERLKPRVGLGISNFDRHSFQFDEHFQFSDKI